MAVAWMNRKSLVPRHRKSMWSRYALKRTTMFSMNKFSQRNWSFSSGPSTLFRIKLSSLFDQKLHDRVRKAPLSSPSMPLALVLEFLKPMLMRSKQSVTWDGNRRIISNRILIDREEMVPRQYVPDRQTLIGIWVWMASEVAAYLSRYVGRLHSNHAANQIIHILAYFCLVHSK